MAERRRDIDSPISAYWQDVPDDGVGVPASPDTFVYHERGRLAATDAFACSLPAGPIPPYRRTAAVGSRTGSMTFTATGPTMPRAQAVSRTSPEAPLTADGSAYVDGCGAPYSNAGGVGSGTCIGAAG